MRVELFHGLNETPALDLAVRGWAEMTEKGFGDGSLNAHAGQSALVGFEKNGRDELAVGVVTFEHDTSLKRIWLSQAYVLPEFRGRGVYKGLWTALAGFSTGAGAKSIQFGTHVKNAPMRAVAHRTGCIEQGVVLRYDL
jgi:GNAT superfamily N-acetyltransferase